MDEGEREYYRTVEDHFATVRGTPFLLLPKDFALLRQWWHDGVPVAAALAGISEVAARRCERDGDPVSSLAYCRHAVARHARRLATAAVGSDEGASPLDVGAALAGCVAATRAVAERWRDVPGVAQVLAALARSLEALPASAPPASLDEAMAELERAALLALEPHLPAPPEGAPGAGDAAGDRGLSEAVRERTRRALRLKQLRAAVGLPRLELTAAE